MWWELSGCPPRQLVTFGNETCFVKVVKTPEHSFNPAWATIGAVCMIPVSKGPFIRCPFTASVACFHIGVIDQPIKEETPSACIPADQNDNVLYDTSPGRISLLISPGFRDDHFILCNHPSGQHITKSQPVSTSLGLPRTGICVGWYIGSLQI